MYSTPKKEGEKKRIKKRINSFFLCNFAKEKMDNVFFDILPFKTKNKKQKTLKYR